MFAARHEHARSLVDALVRRVPLFRDARDQGLAAAVGAAALLANELGWTPAARARAIDDYRAAVDRSRLLARRDPRRHMIVMTPGTARRRANRLSTASALAHGTFSRWLTYLPCADGRRS